MRTRVGVLVEASPGMMFYDAAVEAVRVRAATPEDQTVMLYFNELPTLVRVGDTAEALCTKHDKGHHDRYARQRAWKLLGSPMDGEFDPR